MWRILQIVFIVLGFLFVFASKQFSMPGLIHAGMASFGLSAIVIGWEAILTQHIVVGSRRRGSRRTYTGLAAVLQGAQFNVIGLFLIGMALMLQFNIDGRSIAMQFAQRPGLPLVAGGILVLAQSLISFLGAREYQDGSGVTLVILRLFPGAILLLVGVILTALGVFEFIAPDIFDRMGGEFLETLYGIR